MGGVELAAIDGINGQAQHLVDALGDRQAAVLKGGHAVGGIGHGHIAGLHRELQVVFRLGEPFQEGNAGADLVLGARDDYHAGPLLDGHRLTACKAGAGQRGHLDAVALGVAGQHLGGEEGSAGGGTDIGQQAADLDIVAAELAAGTAPALDVGDIVVIPQLAEGRLVKVQSHHAVLGIKDGRTQFLCAAEQVIGQRVAAIQGLAVVGRSRLGIGPVVVFVCGLVQPLHSGKIRIGHACGLGKGDKVGDVQVEQLGGLCYGKDLELPVVHQVTLFEKIGDIGRLLFFGQVGAQVNGKAHLIQRKGGVRVGGDDVGELFGTHLALGGGQHTGLQVVHAALTGAFDPDVLLFAHGGVELLHQLVEAFQLIAVVVGPDRDGGGQLASAAGSAAQRHGGAQQQTDGRTKDSFHYLISPIPTKRLTKKRRVLSFLK